MSLHRIFNRYGIGEIFIGYILLFIILLKLFSIVIAFVTTFGLFLFYLRFLQQRHSYWRIRSINGPVPNLFFGHTLMLRHGLHTIDSEWIQKYGSVVGTYMAGQPDLIISDVDILRDVLVRNFDAFTNRRPRASLNRAGRNILAYTLTDLTDQHWKNVRNMVTPIFSSGKIKNMMPMFYQCLSIFAKVFDHHANMSDNGGMVDIKKLCSSFTMDLIAKITFSIDINAQNDENSLFVRHASQLFNFRLHFKRVLLSVLFPNITNAISNWFNYQLIANESNEFFITLVQNILRQRKVIATNEEPMPFDFLQLLVNVQKEEIIRKTNTVDGGENNKILREIEIIAQSFLFVLAGYETSASTLHFAIYLLALHPTVQNKCLDEVVDVCGLNNLENITYEQVNQLVYIDQVISETLRLYPPSIRIDRNCGKDIQIGDLKIDKNTIVSVPIWVIHHSKKYYHDPETFDPNRFSTTEKAKRDPLTYLPFGYGPRNCLGMRFAQFELKITIAYLLRRFEFVPNEKTPKMPLKLAPIGLCKPAQPIFLNVRKRLC